MSSTVETFTPRGSDRRKRIVLTAMGSLGDLHPSIAIGLGLQARGHDVVIATGECYRRKVEALGLGFRGVRPHTNFVADPEVMRRMMDYRWGTVRALREVALPIVRESYEDTLVASEGADLLVSHPITFATRLVAEKRGIPWVSALITPLCLASPHDLSVLPVIQELSIQFRFLGPAFWGPVKHLLTSVTRSWARPIIQLRAEIGLPKARDNPLVNGYSPRLVLATFSKLLADRQVNWPPQTIQTGFPFYDHDGSIGLPTELGRFLDAGPPPVVFTLGDTAAMVAGAFFEESVAAAKRLGRRAILVVGKTGRRPSSLPDGIIAVEYAPFSELFPRASVVVHAGGIGSSGLAMRAGRPMLVVPHAHDQPDNAQRLRRLGIARVLSPQRYKASRAADELKTLLEDPEYARKAAEVGEQVCLENGVRAACDALEAIILPR